MSSMATEYRHVIAGEQLSGFGYFVALPSLHVAAATFIQRSVRQAPWLYWTLLPVNGLLALSTVLLGYHYLLDLPSGVLLGLLFARLLPTTGSQHVPPGGGQP
jgi:membrane-associated phospholipid phosphatase